MANKFHAKAVVTADGQRFDSQREYARWRVLQLLEHAGEIRALERQVPFDLHAPDGTVIARYIADFVYERRDGTPVWEDAKGVRTAMYRLKRKWMKAEYGIEIFES